MVVFGQKMHIIVIFGGVWVQKQKITNLAAFGHCLVTHTLIFINKHLRIKNNFLLILAH